MVKRSAPPHPPPPSGGKVTQREGEVKRRRDGSSDQHPGLVAWVRLVSITGDVWKLILHHLLITRCQSYLSVPPPVHPSAPPPPLTFTSQVGEEVKLFLPSSPRPFPQEGLSLLITAGVYSGDNSVERRRLQCSRRS